MTPRQLAAELQRRLDRCDATAAPLPRAVILPFAQYTVLATRWLAYDVDRRGARFGDTPVYAATRWWEAPADAVDWDLEAPA